MQTVISQMGHVKSITFRLRKWFVLIMGMMMMMMMMMLKGVLAAEDQIGVPASAGLLCISDCATCPVICSPPPPSPSPKVFYSPIAPQPPTHHSPPQSHYHSPPPPPPRTSEPPLGSGSSWDTPPPPPPAPFKYNNNVPPTGEGPPIAGQHDYPYPYYYFYASKASFISCHSNVLLVMLFYFAVFFFC